MEEQTVTINPAKKSLYGYQQKDIDTIFQRIKDNPNGFNALYQLPTGGGKTVIFSELARRYIKETGKKVLILTHRIELCAQTSKMLDGFDVDNYIINSDVKELEVDNHHDCFVAMVETLNNRLSDEALGFDNLGLVIIDEAHYNSFTKLFKFFDKCFLLGVTATPLSSNASLPMKDNYDELLTGEPIPSLIEKDVLARAETHCINVGLGSLKVGISGDYTVKSSEVLYSNDDMQEKLFKAYEEKAKGKKTLISNNGIQTSKEVYYTFKSKGYDIRHLDNKCNKQERAEILAWFKVTPNAILTSVSILTTGFDEPTVDVIILNRATKSLTLYYQMIGRGSRWLKEKTTFSIIDLGNNVARFGLWESELDWHNIFLNPDKYLESILSDFELEKSFVYELPEEIKPYFPSNDNIHFDVKGEYALAIKERRKPRTVIDFSIDNHVEICLENASSRIEAKMLSKLLEDSVTCRIKRYSYCICRSSKNYLQWLKTDYYQKLNEKLADRYKEP